jgi:hypothetical protein
MGSIVSFTALTLLGYILIVLRVPVLIIPIFLLALVAGWKKIVGEVKKIKVALDKKTVLLIIVFIIGIAGQLAVISPSGRFLNGDIVFWSSHAHDASWHISLMNEIKSSWPFQNPVFAGEKLVNYHFFSDIIPSLVSKYWPGSNINLDLDLYFRIFPLIYSIFLGTSAYFLTKRITGKSSAGVWAVVFTYFAGSFGYIATYLKGGTIGGESIFWATQPQSASGNPPQIISDFLVLTFLYYVFDFIKRRSKSSLIFSILILGTLAEFKVYAAIVLMGATLVAGLWQILIPAGLLTAALYLPNSSGATSFLIFQPWWYIRTMIVESGRLNLIDWELRRQTYIYENNWKRVIFLESLGFAIFFLGNLGVRIAGLWDFVKSGRTVFKDKFSRLLVSTITISLVLPLLFLQKGVASNTSQFLQYFVLLFGILAAISVSRFIKNLKKPFYQILFIITLLTFMVPTQIGLLKEFYSRPAFAKITSAEIESLNFIRNNSEKDAIILSPPADPYIKQVGPTPNVWGWFDTAYVSAISGRRVYFSDYEQVDIMGYDFKERKKIVKQVFESKSPDEVSTLIKSSGADYVYFPKAISPQVDLDNLNLELIFSNTEVEIWKI